MESLRMPCKRLSQIRTGCANQRPSGSVRGSTRNGCPCGAQQRPTGNLCGMPCPEHKMIEINAQSKGSPEVGHWLNFSPNPTDILHDLCGPHDVAGALCPNCNKPLMRL